MPVLIEVVEIVFAKIVPVLIELVEIVFAKIVPVLIEVVDRVVILPPPTTSKAINGELLQIPTPFAVTLKIFTLPVPVVIDAFAPPLVEEYNQKSIALPKLLTVLPSWRLPIKCLYPPELY